jgi:hypothetical protein
VVGLGAAPARQELAVMVRETARMLSRDLGAARASARRGA